MVFLRAVRADYPTNSLAIPRTLYFARSLPLILVAKSGKARKWTVFAPELAYMEHPYALLTTLPPVSPLRKSQPIRHIFAADVASKSASHFIGFGGDFFIHQGKSVGPISTEATKCLPVSLQIQSAHRSRPDLFGEETD